MSIKVGDLQKIRRQQQRVLAEIKERLLIDPMADIEDLRKELAAKRADLEEVRRIRSLGLDHRTLYRRRRMEARSESLKERERATREACGRVVQMRNDRWSWKKISDAMGGLSLAKLKGMHNLEKIEECKDLWRSLPPGSRDEVLLFTLDSIGLSPRSMTLLRRQKITTIGHLIGKTVEELRQTPNVGPQTLLDIEFALKEFGLHLESSPAHPDKLTQEEALDLRVEQLDFSIRTRKCCELAKVATLRDLVGRDRQTWKKNWFYNRTLDEVEAQLSLFGLRLGMDIAPG